MSEPITGRPPSRYEVGSSTDEVSRIASSSKPSLHVPPVEDIVEVNNLTASGLLAISKPSLFARIKEFFTKTDKIDVAGRTLGIAGAAAAYNFVTAAAMNIPHITYTGLSHMPMIGGVVLGVTEGLAAFRRLYKDKDVSKGEMLFRMLFEHIIPTTVAFFAGSAIISGALVASHGAALLTMPGLVAKGGAVQLGTYKGLSWFFKKVADSIPGWGKREDSLPEMALNQLRKKQEWPKETSSVATMSSMRADLPEEGFSAEFTEALDRPPDDDTDGGIWYKQNAPRSAMHGMRDYAAPTVGENGDIIASDRIGVSRLVTDDPLDMLAQHGEDKAIRDVRGDGNCWVTAANYAFLAHFRDDDDYRKAFFQKHTPPTTEQERPYLKMLSEMHNYLDMGGNISDDQLMSLITSKKYGPVVRDFTHGLPGVSPEAAKEDAPGDVKDLSVFAQYCDIELKHLDVSLVGHERETPQAQVYPAGSGKPKKALVLIPPKDPSKHAGHYVVLENRTIGRREEAFLRAFGGRLPSIPPRSEAATLTPEGESEFRSLPNTPTNPAGSFQFHHEAQQEDIERLQAHIAAQEREITRLRNALSTAQSKRTTDTDIETTQHALRDLCVKQQQDFQQLIEAHNALVDELGRAAGESQIGLQQLKEAQAAREQIQAEAAQLDQEQQAQIQQQQQKITELIAERDTLIALLAIQAAQKNDTKKTKQDLADKEEDVKKLTVRLIRMQAEQERQIESLTQSHKDKQTHLKNQLKDTQTRLQKAQSSLETAKAEVQNAQAANRNKQKTAGAQQMLQATQERLKQAQQQAALQQGEVAALKRQLRASEAESKRVATLQQALERTQAQIEKQNKEIEGQKGLARGIAVGFEERERSTLEIAEAEFRAQLEEDARTDATQVGERETFKRTGEQDTRKNRETIQNLEDAGARQRAYTSDLQHKLKDLGEEKENAIADLSQQLQASQAKQAEIEQKIHTQQEAFLGQIKDMMRDTELEETISRRDLDRQGMDMLEQLQEAAHAGAKQIQGLRAEETFKFRRDQERFEEKLASLHERIDELELLDETQKQALKNLEGKYTVKLADLEAERESLERENRQLQSKLTQQGNRFDEEFQAAIQQLQVQAANQALRTGPSATAIPPAAAVTSAVATPPPRRAVQQRPPETEQHTLVSIEKFKQDANAILNLTKTKLSKSPQTFEQAMKQWSGSVTNKQLIPYLLRKFREVVPKESEPNKLYSTTNASELETLLKKLAEAITNDQNPLG